MALWKRPAKSNHHLQVKGLTGERCLRISPPRSSFAGPARRSAGATSSSRTRNILPDSQYRQGNRGETPGLSARPRQNTTPMTGRGSCPRYILLPVPALLQGYGWDGIYIAVLIGLKDFKWKYIPRNDDFISMMVDREVDFWVNHVEKNIPQNGTGQTYPTN